MVLKSLGNLEITFFDSHFACDDVLAATLAYVLFCLDFGATLYRGDISLA